MATRPLPSPELVRQLLAYDVNTGEFTWRPRPREMFTSNRGFATWNTRFGGTRAGAYDAKGYRIIFISYIAYKAHRLAWLYVRGEPVPDQIDHIDRDKANNRIDNLRAASGSQNNAHRLRSLHTKSGAKGVHRANQPKGFCAQISFRNRNIYLGTFATIEEAAKAYQDAAIRLHGEFASWD